MISLDLEMPVSADSERSILGAIMLDNQAYDQAERISYDDFSLDAHKRIFARMAALFADGHAVDIVTLANELHKHREVDAIGGVAYLASLTEGLPRRLSIGEYVGIVKEKAQLRALIHTCTSIATHASDGSHDAAELIEQADTRLLQILGESSVEPESLAAATKQEFEIMLAERDSGKSIIGIPTGIEDLDKATSGYVEGELTVLAGRPGQGKSSALIQALIQCGRGEIAAHCFQQEMTKGQMLRRMWCDVAGLKFGQLRRPQFLHRLEVERLRDAAAEVAKYKLIIETNNRLTSTQLVARARISKRRHQTRLFALDYLQKLTFDGKADQRHIEVTDAAVKLANLAKNEHVAVLALSSLTEGTGKFRNAAPTLESLRQSGDIKYEASTVVFIHREVDEKEQLKDEGWMIIAKQRNGATGRFAVRYNGQLQFESADSPKPEPPQQYTMHE